MTIGFRGLKGLVFQMDAQCVSYKKWSTLQCRRIREILSSGRKTRTISADWRNATVRVTSFLAIVLHILAAGPISTPSPGFPHHPHDDLVKAIRRRRLSAAQIVGVAIVAYRRLMLGKQFPVSPQTAFCNCYLPHGLGFDIDKFRVTQQRRISLGRIMQLQHVSIEASIAKLI
jgi:hypothetical protein